MNKIELAEKVMPTTYFWVILLVSIIFHYTLNLEVAIKFPYNALGVVLILAGVWINIHTDTLFKKHKTTVKPHKKPTKLVLEGSFKFSRHPMYLGMFLCLLGLSIFIGSLITLIFPLIFGIIMEIIFIPVEEESMKKAFGKKYTNYQKKVRKWI